MKKPAPLGNPATGEVQIILSDGKARIACFDIDAMYILEEASSMSLFELLRRSRMGMSLTILQFLIYAGCYRQATSIPEPWSPSVVRSLLKMKTGQHNVWLRAIWAFYHSVTAIMEDEAPGETLAALPESQDRGNTTSR